MGLKQSKKQNRHRPLMTRITVDSEFISSLENVNQQTPEKTEEWKSGMPRLGRRATVFETSSSQLENSTKRVVIKDEETRAALTASWAQAAQKNILLSHLDEAEQADIFDAIMPVRMKENEIIIRQGDEGQDFYIIHRGFVEVHVL